MTLSNSTTTNLFDILYGIEIVIKHDLIREFGRPVNMLSFNFEVKSAPQ